MKARNRKWKGSEKRAHLYKRWRGEVPLWLLRFIRYLDKVSAEMDACVSATGSVADAEAKIGEHLRGILREAK